jgi:vacuolar-type H+-ATPase subunit H
MESSQKQQTTSERLTNDLRKALEDLRKAGENASGDVRAGIESAVSRIREASSAATPEDWRAQLDSFRDWLQSTTADVLDEVEKEVRKRREQLRGQGGSKSSGSKSSGSKSSGSKSSGSKSSGSKSSGSSSSKSGSA